MKRPIAAPSSAFTLLEIMLVVLIIGLLIGMAIRYTAPSINTAQETAARGHIQNLKTSLLIFQSKTGSLPTTEQGLKALATKPDGVRNWIRFIESIPQDPWHQDFFYLLPGKHNPDSYDLYSAGPDKTPNTPDDIGNWEPPTESKN